MPEEPFKNREIVEMFEDVKKGLNRIETQTTITNGKVAEVNKWRERVNGGAIVASFFMTVIVIPILAWAIYVLVNIKSEIDLAVTQALASYEIQIK